MPTATSYFQLKNDGEEFHEIVVARKADGVTDSFEDILALPEEEAGAKIVMVGATSPRRARPVTSRPTSTPVTTSPSASSRRARKSPTDEVDGQPHFTPYAKGVHGQLAGNRREEGAAHTEQPLLLVV